MTVSTSAAVGGTGDPVASAVVALSASSGNVAAAIAAATLPVAPGKTNYLSGIAITGSGATAASVVNPTVTGLNGGTLTLTLAVVAGATLSNTPLILTFNPPIPAAGINTAIVVSVPSLGAGNTNSTASLWGFVV